MFIQTRYKIQVSTKEKNVLYVHLLKRSRGVYSEWNLSVTWDLRWGGEEAGKDIWFVHF